MSKYSVNNRLVVEAYKTDSSLKATVTNGFAMVQQKVSLVGLKVLIGAIITDGRYVAAGSIAYIREQHLHTQAWAKTPLQCDSIDTPFIIVDLTHIEFIHSPDEAA